MEKFSGIIIAVVALAGIGFGHVFVRKFTYRYGIKFAPLVLVIGLGLMYLSLHYSDLWSAIMGVFGITVVWDGVEIYRQEKRIKEGWAEANPKRLKNETI